MKRTVTLLRMGVALGLLHVSLAAALDFDPPGRPNESGHAIAEKLAAETTSAEQIYEYFRHYSPVVRKKASEEMGRRGEEAMPLIVKGLKSSNRYEIRAACDAINGMRGFFGVNVKDERNNPITIEMAAPTAPLLAELLDHEHMYVRVGALYALSRCGKAAAPYLPRVVKFLKDDEWWLRDGATYVLEGVGSPEADRYTRALAKAMLKEQHIQCLNNMSKVLGSLLQTASTADAIARTIVEQVEGMKTPYHRQRGRDVLNKMGTEAAALLPEIEKMIKRKEQAIAKAMESGSLGKYEEWDLEHLRTTQRILAGEEKKPKR